ncbi:hypothetical protein V6N12_040424 [Hibiscus sabdariffa]|uniref:Uncharacterized protein n=1 Tax=Hibiscus sabdariffa TaxID=183260 RepID=A0ABR2E474_9ROSI
MHIYKQDYGILTTAHLLFKHFQFSNFRAKQARKLTPQCLERRWLNLPKLVDAMAPEFHSAMLLNVLLNYVNPLAVAVDRLRGDDLVNGTAAQPQANTNSSSHSVHLKLPPGKDNVEVNNISSTEVVLSHNKNRGVGGGGGKGRGRDEGNSGRNEAHRKRVFNKEDYRVGEFAECMVRTRCRGLRLDCPLHCGGPCVYDCQHMCKAHCRRP